MGNSSAERIGLPVRPFLYTIDQIAALINMSEETVKNSYLFYQGRSVGSLPKDRILVRNIAPDGEKPEWRASEKDFVRWLRFKGFRYHERGYIK